MILIDALYINNGGGKVLLDYLVETLKKKEIDAYYLFDLRIKGEYPEISVDKKNFLKASLFNRYNFYREFDKKFTKVFCFGNLPPFQKQKKIEVFTYFHQPLFISTPSDSSLILKFKIKLKTLFLQFFKKNTNFWLVQSKLIKDGLIKKYDETAKKVQVLPFYPPLISSSKDLESKRKKNTFIYVSNVSSHKNHKRLIEAFCSFYDKHKKGELTLTVHSKHTEIYNLINDKINNGYPISNLGFINREELRSHYLRSEYLIFPSLTESFGLGLIEAIECGCKVIGADLPYTYEVCKPSSIFNPFSVESIESAINESISKEVPETEQKIYNQIDKLIEYLTDNEDQK